MEKIKIIINKITPKEIKYNKVKITMNNYISIENYEVLLNDIMNTIILNNEITDKIANIEIRFAKGVLDLLTNVDTSDLTADDYFSSDLIKVMENNIGNYSKCLENILKEYTVYQTKVGFGMIASKVPSEDGMSNVINSIGTMVKEMDTDKLQILLKGIAFDKMPLANFLTGAKKGEIVKVDEVKKTTKKK